MKSTKLTIGLGIALLLTALVSIIAATAQAPAAEYDFGDAPDRPYPTLLQNDGARHLIDGLTYLGALVDGEPDGQPDLTALGDDNAPPGTPDDEDGGLFSSPLYVGHVGDLDVVASTDGALDAWLDFNGNGVWDSSEQIFSAHPLAPGMNNLTFPIPGDAMPGPTYSRLRFSQLGDLPPLGEAPNGEVEDYLLEIRQPGREGWGKWVNGQPWTPGMVVRVETSQTITVTDVLTTFTPFNHTETWIPSHLRYLRHVASSGVVEVGDGGMQWMGDPTATGVVTLTKWFHVEPCTWPTTTLEEILEVPQVPEPVRPVIFEKIPPLLWIDSDYQPDVTAGQPASFTLLYGNDGGYENNVSIWNYFPPEAPFVDSVPPPDDTGAYGSGTFAMWIIGDLPGPDQGPITVTVDIDPRLQISSTVLITDVILDHTGARSDITEIRYHVSQVPYGWLDGHVTDRETGGQAPTCTPATVQVDPGGIILPADPGTGYYGPEPFVPGTYDLQATAPGYSPQSVPSVSIVAGMTTTQDFQLERPVIVVDPPDFISVTAVYSKPISYTLNIDNRGHQALEFEIFEAGGGDIPWVWTDPVSGVLPSATRVSIDVTFHCTRTGDLANFLEIAHNDPCQDPIDVPIRLHCEPPVPEGWGKWVNGQRWTEPELATRVETSQTITVTDVITAFTDFRLNELWDPDRLELLDTQFSHGKVITGPGALDWIGPPSASGVVTLTKWFHVRPSDWPDTVLREILIGPEVPFPARPVRLIKIQPLLWIDADWPPGVLAGDLAGFVLRYGNDGGFENNVSIRNAFPPEARFVGSDPLPRDSDPAGLWAEWYVGDLAMDQEEQIAVEVAIAPRLPASTTLGISDVIFDHLGRVADRVDFELHVDGTAGDPLFDLGDAPDSTNHAGALMMTYPAGVIASFPTVYDPGTGLPEGPLHLNPLGDAWLGPWVSAEFDADLPPDADGLTNIDPPLGLANQDGFDDGVAPPIVLPHCVPTFFTYTVTITPGAPAIDRYVNVWFDWNRDGDWADLFDCDQLGPAPEWAVRDNMLPAGTPPGTYVFATPRFLPFNRAWDQPTWMRISIADRPAPRTEFLPDGSLWAVGAGPAGGYRYGETEDYYVQPPRAEWKKWVDGEPWSGPDMIVTVETTQTVTVVDVVKTDPRAPFVLTETWNPDELRLRDYSVEPFLPGVVFSDTGLLIWDVPPEHPEVITLTKWFHVEPCDWPETILEERLEGVIEDEPFRPVRFEKKLPVLDIGADYYPEVVAGDLALFTLVYSNTGGFENDVLIRNIFPDTAPYVTSEPPADRVSADGLSAEWDVPALPGGSVGNTIDVVVAIDPTVPPSTTIEIWDWIYDHTGREVDRVLIELHVQEPPPAQWDKWINGRPWRPGITLTVETSETIEVVDVVHVEPGVGFVLAEYWNPAELQYAGHTVEPAHADHVIVDEGALIWRAPPDHTGVLTLTKRFHVEPCIWEVTVLEEFLEGVVVPDPQRRVIFEKKPPQLNIGAEYYPEVVAGDLALFTLVYSNTGGFENDVLIRNAFPENAPYVTSEPPADRVSADGLLAEWDVPALPGGSVGNTIDVVVAIEPTLQPSTTIEIWDWIYDHTGREADRVLIELHVQEPPPAQWDKWINGRPWRPGITVTVETSETIEVVDVVHVEPGVGFVLTEHWSPAELRYIGHVVEPAYADRVVVDSGRLIWSAPPGHTGVLTLTKRFHVEPCDWPATILEESLEGVTVPDPQRRVIFEKKPPQLNIGARYEPEVFAGDVATFTLIYSNTGGFENDVLIRNAFPDAAPYLASDPPADRVGPGGLSAEWDIPTLPGGSVGNTIDVEVTIDPSLPPSTTIEIWDWIYDHTGRETDRVQIEFHIQEPPPAEWDKWINGQPWTPGITFTVETSNTVEVVDVIKVPPGIPFDLFENWIAGELKLQDYMLEPSHPEWVVRTDDSLTLHVPPEHTGVVTLTKLFHVEPCTWERTELRELLEGVRVVDPFRPVIFEKTQPDLRIGVDDYDPQVYAGEVATFTLVYSNAGGYETDVWIRNDFPPEARFIGSNPPASWKAPDGSQAVWRVGDLATGAGSDIDVTVAIGSDVVPSDTIDIIDVIYNHIGEPMDEVWIRYHVDETPPSEGDLYIKDNPLDDGSVPSSPPWWVSPDIWVRNDGDCTQTDHQNPIAGTLNTICVRVRNRLATTIHNVKVDAYWGSAALGFHWPGGWSVAGSAHILSLAPGGQAVRAIPWHTPNITGHFCLLVRADSPDDPIASGFDTVAPVDEVQNNNNIAMKNLNIVAFPEVTECGFYSTEAETDVVYMDVVNTTDSPATVDIVFESADFPLGSGEIVVEPGGLQWAALVNFVEVGTTLVPTAFPAWIRGIDMAPYETGPMTVTITAEIDERFSLGISEYVNGLPVGGIVYLREMPYCVFLPVVMKRHSSALSGAVAWAEASEAATVGMSVHDMLEQDAAPPPPSPPIYASRGRIFPK